jgi:DNA-binding response OmpR family regulator
MNESAPEEKKHTSANLAGKKVLWVEDDQFLKNIISHKLTQEKVSIIYAEEGETALQSAMNEKPDLIVLDILLPGLDGVEVLRRLKSSDETKNIPVIMFSNVDDKARIEESQKHGAVGFFVKTSMNMDEIIAELDKALK